MFAFTNSNLVSLQLPHFEAAIARAYHSGASLAFDLAAVPHGNKNNDHHKGNYLAPFIFTTGRDDAESSEPRQRDGAHYGDHPSPHRGAFHAAIVSPRTCARVRTWSICLSVPILQLSGRCLL